MARTKKQDLSERCLRAFKRALATWHPNLYLSWRPTEGSGNQTHDKGDLELDVNSDPRFLFEHKATNAKQHVLKLAALEKAQQEAWAKNRLPAFGITFRNPETLRDKHFVVLAIEDWEITDD